MYAPSLALKFCIGMWQGLNAHKHLLVRVYGFLWGIGVHTVSGLLIREDGRM